MLRQMYEGEQSVRIDHLNPSRHCCQDVNHQAGMLGIVARHKVAIHDQALPQVAGDDEASVEEQQNVQREQEAYTSAHIITKFVTIIRYYRLLCCKAMSLACCTKVLVHTCYVHIWADSLQ